MSRRAVAVVLLVAGVLALARGAWIPVKAMLGQQLLELAWMRAENGEAAPRAWPWAQTWPVARLRAPAAGVSLIVLAGATGEPLAWGPGHVDGTAPPGAAGNCVIAGHRDTVFRFLADLAQGDELIVDLADGRSVHYRVSASAVIDESRTDILERGDEPQLTLVTCWPFDAIRPGGRLRYAVRARATMGREHDVGDRPSDHRARGAATGV